VIGVVYKRQPRSSVTVRKIWLAWIETSMPLTDSISILDGP
jgi:hypothetical protein